MMQAQTPAPLPPIEQAPVPDFTPMPPVPDFLFWNEIILPLAAMVVAIILGYPIVRALVRRIEGKGERVDAEEVQALRAEVTDLRQRLEGFDEANQRMAELEERVDFTERMLAQHREARPLGSGG